MVLSIFILRSLFVALKVQEGFVEMSQYGSIFLVACVTASDIFQERNNATININSGDNIEGIKLFRWTFSYIHATLNFVICPKLGI